MAFPLSSNFTRRSLKTIASSLLAAGLSLPLLAHADAVARFDGGIGVVPATWAGANNTAPTGGAAAANAVNDTPPPGRPWVISDLKASVLGDGSFDVRGEGLVLAGGNNVGVSANLAVRMRLYCGGAAGVPLTKFTSNETTTLEPNGDFHLRGQLAVVNQPLDCPNARLLIIAAGPNAANAGGWFAAGIPKD